MLPSISILAPAYNEEATIVESVHSLLSLAYPSYEVIVVNDGSRDGTLAALVREFHLEPAGEGENGALASMPVRTIWRSPDIPNLTVIDKANGGKADALNAGLNRAWGEYVCSIDADSLLDPQALLRALFQVLARDREVIAIGGNIFPVNGCSVEHGQLQEIALPEAPLARFQTIEYLRSFIGGRLGWTALDGLIIISGAFGIFRRGSVLGIGGYLTGSGAHRQETVGEDMELVVRLVRADREAGGRGTVEYAYNATCWTEVPEDGVSLGKQRDRWHRGLMEVLAFHRDMAGKPRYGATGLLALPYFLLFELVGPWLESIGYVVLTLSLVLNLVDPLVTLTVFSIAILFGIAVSTASVLFAERHILYFRGRDLLRLLAVAFIENFGHRQATSMARVVANIQFFRGRKGWQKLARRGFSKAGGPS
jgi:cellulose synthase/poly-beta-1,6-N-acetylglucosamine synthase-like glycosyltransferase